MKNATKKKMMDNILGSKSFRISWTNYTGLYVDIEAKDKVEARLKWEKGEGGKPIVSDEEFQEDSISIEENE